MSTEQDEPENRFFSPHDTRGQQRMRDDAVDRAIDRIVEQGRPRLYRTWPQLLATALVAGMEVALGVLALLTVQQATGSSLLAGIAFSVGLIALLLGYAELFTEGFLVPIVVVVAREARYRHLMRFWAGTLLGNLVGGWVLTWLVMLGFPELGSTAAHLGAEFVHAGVSLQSLCLAILAGSAITLMTRMHNGTDNDVAKVIASVVTGFLIVGTGMHHSVLDSLLVFAGIHAGAEYGYGAWAVWFGWSLLGNFIGGIGITTALRIVRGYTRIYEWRHS
ncbi:formate/nitrite transporter FocA (FNT family) [Saccharopolyspora lacisalsi]|uniref:Formate/nitrite transporter FocA (FNT family) n=1 Tax=Halosaccharopolyspora lacisalsi TaxID=1000566 RepID=A0A839DVA3_9PSEU|nr:formate/nitrite transporter family protein [Halosaccharopolyspora lacisalsi]MBA8824186.1 formate/nitrite transporter FocA (FNT family) [Halosaccharopolyspora lacisalsi]